MKRWLRVATAAESKKLASYDKRLAAYRFRVMYYQRLRQGLIARCRVRAWRQRKKKSNG